MYKETLNRLPIKVRQRLRKFNRMLNLETVNRSSVISIVDDYLLALEDMGMIDLEESYGLWEMVVTDGINDDLV